MYRIIGDDGKEYGPVPADQLQRWIAEGRANAESRVIAEGSFEWKPLGSFSEFAPWLKPASALRPAPAPLPFAAPARQNNSFATVGLVLAILSFCCCCCCYGFPFNLSGLLCSFIGFVQIRSEPERYQGEGIAVAGMVLSVISVLLSIAFFLMATLGQTQHLFRELQRL